MLAPSIFNKHFADSFFNDSFDSIFDNIFRAPLGKTGRLTMDTDIQDLGENYQMEMELPGYEKEDLKADLQNGYLTISAEHSSEKDEKDEDGKFIRRERYTGSCRRSFYVGEQVQKEEIKASFENGVLKLLIPKKEAPKAEGQTYIAIE